MDTFSVPSAMSWYGAVLAISIILLGIMVAVAGFAFQNYTIVLVGCIG